MNYFSATKNRQVGEVQVIEQKLGEFKKKFYLSALLRGAVFFVAIGAVYFMATAWVEELLWLPKSGRTILFWAFIIVELGLWFYWIWPSLSVLAGLKAPMSHQEAARIIGLQIPEIGDRLTNTLELLNQSQETELVLASIDQKSKSLSPFYFSQAIDLKENLKYLRWLIVPALLVIIIWFFGDLSSLFDGYKRVAAYNQEFVRPAPYALRLLNQDLQSRSNQEIQLSVEASGGVLPSEVYVVYNGKRQTMTPQGPGKFTVLIPPQSESFELYLGTDQFRSKDYQYVIVDGPEIQGFSIQATPPSYSRMGRETIENTGNLRVLAGSTLKWVLNTEYTDQIIWHNKTDTAYFVARGNGGFDFTKSVFKTQKYSLSTNNKQVGYEPAVAYTIEVYPDTPPKIKVETQKDTLNRVTHHQVLAWDDFLVSKIDVVCYPAKDPQNQRKQTLEMAANATTQAPYTFPKGFELMQGVSYQYYFEAWDNDAVRGPKSVQSRVFGHQEVSASQAQERLLSLQNKQTNQIEQAIQTFAEQNKQAEQLEQNRRQKERLNWQDERDLDRLLKQQQQQLERIQEQTEALKNTLEQLQENESGENQETQQIMERVEEQVDVLKEQSDKWEELRDLQEQLEQEDLLEAMDQNQREQKAQEENLERLVEMTRRFFVTQKMNQISDQLKELGRRQEDLGQNKTDSRTPEQKQQEQERLNSEFEAIKEALDELEQENNKLEQPMDLPRDPGGEMDISNEQQKASEALEQGETPQAEKSQKEAGQKMQEMAQKMGSKMMQMKQQSMQEDTEMLRQILDNLIVFSLAQEGHMISAQKRQLGSWSTPDYINRQNDLRDNFNHIDDSLYALSMRQPMITAKVNQSLSTAGYYLDQSLMDLAEVRFSKANVAQQYVFTQANDLANMLDGVVSQMEQMSMSMPGAGSGQGSGGQGFQLQDIIQQQQSLQNQGQSPGGQGQSPREGSSQDEGQAGQGQQGQSQTSNSGISSQNNGQGAQNNGQGNSGTDGQNKPQGSGDKDGQEKDYSDSPAERAARYSIYRQQQQLRQELEDRLKKQGLLERNRPVLEQMEQSADEVLRNGLSERARRLMKQISYQLIKLEEAQYEQDKEKQRESQTNNSVFDPLNNNPWRQEQMYFDQLDILIKDALPLQPYYKKQVERYFKIRNQANDQF